MKAAVVAAGQPMQDENRMHDLLKEVDYIICADGGMRILEKIGVRPDILIGDFDSISDTSEEKREAIQEFAKDIPVQTYPTRKALTDMEICLSHALEKGVTEAYVFGGRGTRLDHSMANVTMLPVFYQRGMRITMFDDTNEICYVDSQIDLARRSNEWYVSFVPVGLEGATISLEGFEYPLHKKHIEYGHALAVSNHVTADVGHVTVHDGAVFAIFSRDRYVG